ncbi:MAG: phosphoribosylglycinamide formyltransferase [Verrucomicrobiota bacterium]|nr:phosphoribosylglycinamide formyltransferase [Verrucomicrobiota bacterium]
MAPSLLRRYSMKLLGVLASHGGSNLQAILDACAMGRINARVAVVISNNGNALALERARQAGVPVAVINGKTHPDDTLRDQALCGKFRSHGVEIIALAGYMKRLGSDTLNHYRGKILNVHPALLPKFGGQGMYGHYVHEAVLAAGEIETGATIHLVDEVYDHGAIVAQARVPVLKDDTAATIAARVLVAEHRLYVETLAAWCRQ